MQLEAEMTKKQAVTVQCDQLGEGRTDQGLGAGPLVVWELGVRGPVTLGPVSEQMICSCFLSYVLLLPLGACFPLADRAERRWADLTQGSRPNFAWGSSQQPRAPPESLALLIIAKELPTSDQESASFRFRFGRQDDGSEATSFLPADGEKATGPLGNLAEELNGYRKKGGFSFRFGRR
ncbi:PREDICTED: orexigenic neuropeptide QRFP [Chrysochloris asiatica]|uniref:Orexigenic neuropeptide QRFP n=1 Tax=Chrysochloris asiatica TaxID=185453 RepID=A0A9B0T6P6_CHRAS|nr:PREDICTED: orexigenic neuropeptide QRFP [Chrysochloris asiatica]